MSGSGVFEMEIMEVWQLSGRMNLGYDCRNTCLRRTEGKVFGKEGVKDQEATVLCGSSLCAPRLPRTIEGRVPVRVRVSRELTLQIRKQSDPGVCGQPQ